MNILVINCGSSFVKAPLIDSASEEVLAKGLCGKSELTEDWFISREEMKKGPQRAYANTYRSCKTGFRGTRKSKDRCNFILR